MKQHLSTMNGENMLLLLDNVWTDSIDAVREILEAMPASVTCPPA